MKIQLRLYLVFLGLAFLTVGCADPYAGRMAVSGKVILGGKPIKEGIVSFEPLENQETQSGALIKDGQYSIPRSTGLLPGKYRIRVTAGDGVTNVDESEAGGPGGSTNIVSRDTVPPSWNVNSAQEITVSKDGANTFDFDIPKR